MSRDPLRAVEADEDVEEVLTAPRALLYKHSPRCGTSFLARRRVTSFAEEHPDLPVFEVDVVACRELSRQLAERLAVEHASPQAILVTGGRATWSASHFGITSKALEAAL